MATRKIRLPKGFYWRGTVVWLRTDPVTGKPKSTRSTTLPGAIAFRERREELAANPVHQAAAKATVGDWARKICLIKAQTRSEGTADMYNSKVGHAVRIFGRNTPLVDIDANAIDRYIGTRQGEGAKNTTIQRELTCIWQMLRHARRAGDYHLELSQVKPIGFSAGYKPRETFLPPDELPTLLEALTPERAAWVCLAIATGGDISDVERVQPGDYDPERQVMQMRGTKNRHRTKQIPIPDPLLPLLESALGHLPLSWPRVSKDLPELCEKLGITRVTPKDLRRTAGTWLSEMGVRIDTLSRFMRHGGAKVTFDVYAQPRPEATGQSIREQLQKRHSDGGPLGGMADAGDLKPPTATPGPAKTAGNKRFRASPRIAKQGNADTDLLHLAEARVRRLRAASAIAPEEFEQALRFNEALVEAYHMGAGDVEAGPRVVELLQDLEAAS